MGGLGVSLAGFAGLFTALQRSDQAKNLAVYRWRIREIVVSSFQLTFVAFGAVVFSEATDDIGLTARVFSGIAAATFVASAGVRARPGPAWPNEFDRRAARGASFIWAAVMAGNIIAGAEWYLMAVMLVLLLAPTLVFIRAVIDSTKPAAAST